MFANKEMSSNVQQHMDKVEVCNRHVADTHDSPLWQELFSGAGDFGGDARAIALALCSDGVNPFSRELISYSMWPITLGLLNLPRSVRSLFSSLMLVEIVPGPNKHKNTDVYIEVVVNEILSLTNKCLFDAVSGSSFALELNVVLNIMDYPGQNKVFHFGGAGAISACSHCRVVGEHSKALSKVVYFGSHTFLQKHDPLRNDTTFPEKNQASETPVVKDMKLPGHDRLKDVPVEPMHTIKDCVEHIVKLVGKGPDSAWNEKVLRDSERCWYCCCTPRKEKKLLQCISLSSFCRKRPPLPGKGYALYAFPVALDGNQLLATFSSRPLA